MREWAELLLSLAMMATSVSMLVMRKELWSLAEKAERLACEVQRLKAALRRARED